MAAVRPQSALMNIMTKEPPSGAPGYPPGPPQGLAELFGITAAMQMLRRRILIMALVGVTVAVAAFSYLMLQTPTYSATALVMINPRQERVLDSESVVGQLPRDSSTIDSEIELLRSPALLSELGQALGMMRRSDPSAPTAEEISGSLAGAIQVRRRGMTYVIEITATSTDPQRAQLIANTYADVYIASQVNARVDTAARANSWLSRRLA